MSNTSLKSRTKDHIDNLKFVYKTHYKMAEWYEKFDRILTLIVVTGTAALTAAIIWNAVSRPVLLTIAVAVAIVSWGVAAFDFGKSSQKHYSAADECHSLYEDFRDFYTIGLESSEVNNVERFHELVQRRRRLKDKTPRTTNFWHGRLDSQDVLESVQRDLDIS